MGRSEPRLLPRRRSRAEEEEEEEGEVEGGAKTAAADDDDRPSNMLLALPSLLPPPPPPPHLLLVIERARHVELDIISVVLLLRTSLAALDAATNERSGIKSVVEVEERVGVVSVRAPAAPCMGHRLVYKARRLLWRVITVCSAMTLDDAERARSQRRQV